MLAGIAPLAGFVQGGMGGAFKAVASEGFVTKTSSTFNTPKSLTTNPVTVTVTGGSGSYTHAWSSPNAIDSSATAPTAASTAFTATLNPDSTEYAQWIDTVTDTVTGAKLSVEIDVTLNLVSYQ